MRGCLKSLVTGACGRCQEEKGGNGGRCGVMADKIQVAERVAENVVCVWRGGGPKARLSIWRCGRLVAGACSAQEGDRRRQRGSGMGELISGVEGSRAVKGNRAGLERKGGLATLFPGLAEEMSG